PEATILGPYAKDHILDILSGRDTDVDCLNSIPASYGSEFSKTWRPAPSFRSRAFLKVQDGCSHRCSYCIVPIARGPSRSMDLREVVEDVKFLVNAGYSEISLTGIHLGAYGRDLTPKTRLENLIEEILAATSGCRLRLSSIEPQEFSDGLLSLIKHNTRICKHFHIPAQSGDDKILKKMLRPYKTEFIVELLGKILESSPDSCLGMDVMVGFPGETDASFEKTVDFILRSGCNYLHVFPFSPRRGTVAYDMPDRPPVSLSHHRVDILRKISNDLRSKFYGKFVGRTLYALVERPGLDVDEWGKGLTDNYISVRIKGLKNIHEGYIVPIRIDSVGKDEVFGFLVSDSVSQIR
ncbi:MAG: MiaB/RimO family radical SAM methylthiotransferase, partial [Pseudomonadota bacterium]